ncbi:MAG TPA: type II toxin-antitoxin system VapC family toxin, partial [Pirellulales bacterium]|nr:type II toxin-antitoxin system VapC family toxin [Pirellulales bacterium]
ISRNNFELLPITLAHATMVEQLPTHHRDQFDRLLVSQAIIERLPLVSTDSVFEQYGAARMW